MSEVAIVNHALGLLGVPRITSLTEGTKQASLANDLYEPLRDLVMEQRTWSFAAGRARLLPDGTDPAWGYNRRFLMPTTWLRVTKVWERPPAPGAEDTVPTVQWDIEGNHILAQPDTIYVQYTELVTDTARMSPSFRDCLAYRLAADMCLPLIKDKRRAADLEILYMGKLANAGSIDGAQGRPEKKTKGLLVLGR